MEHWAHCGVGCVLEKETLKRKLQDKQELAKGGEICTDVIQENCCRWRERFGSALGLFEKRPPPLLSVGDGKQGQLMSRGVCACSCLHVQMIPPRDPW